MRTMGVVLIKKDYIPKKSIPANLHNRPRPAKWGSRMESKEYRLVVVTLTRHRYKQDREK